MSSVSAEQGWWGLAYLVWTDTYTYTCFCCCFSSCCCCCSHLACWGGHTDLALFLLRHGTLAGAFKKDDDVSEEAKAGARAGLGQGLGLGQGQGLRAGAGLGQGLDLGLGVRSRAGAGVGLKVGARG